MTTADKKAFLPPLLLTLMVFAIPLGPSLKSVFVILSLVSLLCIAPYKYYLTYTFNTLWGRLAVILFIAILIASFWSPAPLGMRWAIVEKYSKLVYLPLFAVGFCKAKTRSWAINAFVLAMVVTCLLSISKAHGWIKMGLASWDASELFYNHIITGFMIAFGAYLTGLLAVQHRGKLRLLYASAFLLMTYQMLFLNTGKTGYLMYALLITFLLLQVLSFKKAVLGIIAFIAIVLIAYTQSPTMQSRVHAFSQDVRLIQHHDNNNNLGFRILFHDFAKSMFLQHPVVGVGTGSFKYSYSKSSPIIGWGDELTDPHSQYWMFLAEQGLIGLGLFIALLLGILVTSFKLQDTKPILWGILLIFSVGCFTDTILCFSAAGFLFITFCAICFGELVEKHK